MVLVILAHGLLALEAAKSLSPTWDEPIYPATGYLNVLRRSMVADKEHPPLAKLFLSIPYLFTRPPIPDLLEKEQYFLAYDFYYRNPSPQNFLCQARCVNIFFSLGVILLLWWAGGIGAALVYAFLPSALANASVAQLEMQTAFWVTLSWISWSRWEMDGRKSWAFLSGAAVGLALLSKYTAVFFLAALGLRFAALLGQGRLSQKKYVGSLCFVAPVIISFAALWLGNPGGLATTAAVLQEKLNYYFFGSFYEGPRWYFWPAGFFIKYPLGFMALGLAGFWRLFKGPCSVMEKTAWWGLFSFAGLCFSPRFAIQNLFPAMPLAVFVARPVFEGMKTLEKFALGMCLAGLVFSTVRTRPFYLNYFNELVGGTGQGWKYLSDSDQDWGQGLRPLAAYLKRENGEGVILCYSGSANPRAEGLNSFQDLLSPALYVHKDRGDLLAPDIGREVLAISAKVRQTEQAWIDPIIKDREPFHIIGGLFFLYDVTQDWELHERMAHLYEATHRPLWAEREKRRVKYIRKRQNLNT